MENKDKAKLINADKTQFIDQVAAFFPYGAKMKGLASKGFASVANLRTSVYGVIKDQIQWLSNHLENKDRVIEIMKERKKRNCLLILTVQVLCLVGCTPGHWFYSGFDDNDLTTLSSEKNIGFNSTMQDSPIFCGSLVIALVLMLLGLIYTTFLGTLLISILSIGTGIFFFTLSNYSFMEFIFMKKLDNVSLVFKCLELLPIPFIAIILVGFGFQTASVFVRQEECDQKVWRSISKILSYVVLLLVSASMVAVQVWTRHGLQQNWKNDTTFDSSFLETPLNDQAFQCYMLTSGLFLGLSCVLAVLMVFSVLAGNLKVPGIYCWICSAFLVAASIVLVSTLKFKQQCHSFYLENLEPYMMCLGFSTIVIAKGIGFPGIIVYVPSLFKMLAGIFRIICVPVLTVFYIFLLLIGLGLRMVAGENATEEYPNFDAEVENNNIEDTARNNSNKKDDKETKKDEIKGDHTVIC